MGRARTHTNVLVKEWAIVSLEIGRPKSIESNYMYFNTIGARYDYIDMLVMQRVEQKILEVLISFLPSSKNTQFNIKSYIALSCVSTSLEMHTFLIENRFLT